MIDWVTVLVPFSHDGQLFGGRVLWLHASGEIEYDSPRAATFEGSHSARVQVKSNGNDMLWISGNLCKVQQGHNVFGTWDLVGLVASFCERLAGCLGNTATAAERRAWWAGRFQVKRADLTESIGLDNRAAVLAWIHGAALTARSRHKGAGQLRGDTLYLGKHSRRWSVKVYSKGQEIETRGRQLPDALATEAMVGYAERALRVEVVLRSLEVEHLDMRQGASWTEQAARQTYAAKIGALEMSEQIALPDEAIKQLPTRLRSSYQLWKEGHDVRAFVARRTFYRHRKELKAFGVDIAEVRPREREREAVSLLPVLQGRWMGVPEWAVGTPFYFEPRRSEGAQLRLVGAS